MEEWGNVEERVKCISPTYTCMWMLTLTVLYMCRSEVLSDTRTIKLSSSTNGSSLPSLSGVPSEGEGLEERDEDLPFALVITLRRDRIDDKFIFSSVHSLQCFHQDSLTLLAAIRFFIWFTKRVFFKCFWELIAALAYRKCKFEINT